MQDLKVCFMTTDDSFELALHSIDDESTNLFKNLMLCFGTMDKGILTVQTEQKATQEVKAKLKAFTQEFSPAAPMLNKINKKISDLEENEYFLILNEIPQSTVKKYKLEVYIDLLNKSGQPNITEEDFNKELTQIEDLADLLQNYNIIQPRNDRRTIIGNKTKADRICRFCQKGPTNGATFRKVAHAISEGLGNKNIILADECDSCNEYFGNSIEPQLITHLDIYRTFLGTKGKNGTPTITYKDGKITHENNMAVVAAKNIERIGNEEVIITLNSDKTFIPIMIYKALVKISLSTIPTGVISDLRASFEWLTDNNATSVKLPKIARNVINSGFAKHPQITNYVRKTNDMTLPHLVSEFRIGSFLYVYIIPFSCKDDSNFLNPEEYGKFWGRFKQYSRLKGWSFDCLDSEKEITITETIRMTKRASS